MIRKLGTRLALLVLGAPALLLPACGGGGGDDAGSAGLTVAITDAASDELASFVVDVVSIELSRIGGDVVSALPGPARVDLVTLESASQILNVLSVPAGTYTRAEVTFDFGNARAQLLDEATPATILDGDGMALSGRLTLPVSIGDALAVAADRHRVLELDFDLDHSVTVDAAANEVRVEPAIVVRVDRSDPRELLFAGALLAVSPATSTFEIELRTSAGARVTDLVVGVDRSTRYQVDGDPFVGAAGLAALAALPAGTWVQGAGRIDPREARIEAFHVEAGGGTFNGGADLVEGHVVGRVGGAGADAILTVLGHSEDRSHTTVRLNETFTIATAFASTKVLMRGGTDALDTDRINVGQRVRVFGTLTGPVGMDATGATDIVRLLPTRIEGFANAPIAGGGQLGVDVVRVGRRAADLFAWSEGGPTPPDPRALVIATGLRGGALGIEAGTAVAAIGFFAAVDDADEDAVASTGGRPRPGRVAPRDPRPPARDGRAGQRGPERHPPAAVRASWATASARTSRAPCAGRWRSPSPPIPSSSRRTPPAAVSSRCATAGAGRSPCTAPSRPSRSSWTRSSPAARASSTSAPSARTTHRRTPSRRKSPSRAWTDPAQYGVRHFS